MFQSILGGYDSADFKEGLMRDKDYKKQKIVISGIGTGGHYFPAVVVAKELQRRNFGVIFLVRKGFVEEEIARLYGLETFFINPRPFSGKSILFQFLALVAFFKSLLRLLPIVKDKIGFSFGGFGSLPLAVACLIKRRPFYLFEPNCIPGRSTRIVAPYARRVFLGMPIRVKIAGRLTLTGIPLRDEFKICDEVKKEKHTILFIGGSQGARSLNKWAISLTKILPEEYRIIIISGQRDYQWVEANKDKRTVVIPFTSTPWNEIKEANVVVSRSGALAGYELLALKKKIIFIPFPYATDNHQYYNAQYFVKAGQAIVLTEDRITEEILAQKIIEMLKHPADNKKSDIIIDAEKRICDIIKDEVR